MTTNMLDRNLLVQFANEAAEYDIKLDEGAGSKSTGKRSVKNRLAEASPVAVEALLDFFAQLNEPAMRAGAIIKFEKALQDKYGQEVEKFVDSQVTPADNAKLSDAELTQLETERREVVKKFHAMMDVWKLINPTDDVSDIPVPKKRTGSRGPRGPRAISGYQWTVNGTDLAAKDNSLQYIASLVEGWKVKDLREFASKTLSTPEAEFTFKTPPETFSLTLPNGISLSAAKMAKSEADEDGEDDNDEDDATA